MKVEVDVLGSPPRLVRTVSGLCTVSVVSVRSLWSLYGLCATLNLKYKTIRAQELCESRGGRPGLPAPISPYCLWSLYSLCGLCTVSVVSVRSLCNTELEICTKELCEGRGGRPGLPVTDSP